MDLGSMFCIRPRGWQLWERVTKNSEIFTYAHSVLMTSCALSIIDICSEQIPLGYVDGGEICPGLTLIRCPRISINVTKCPLALLANFNITCVSEYRQFMSQSVPHMLLFK